MSAKQKVNVSVFSQIGFPDARIQELERKSHLMLELQSFIRRHELTQSKAAVLLGISQPRVSELVSGRISQFSLDELARLCERAGFGIQVKLLRSPRAREAALVASLSQRVGSGSRRTVPAARAGIGVAAARRYVSVEPRPEGRWAVQADGTLRADSLHDKKSAAVIRGRKLAESKRTELVIKNEAGQIVGKNSHGNGSRRIKG